MKRPAAILTVVALVLLGVLSGALATHLFYAQRLRTAGSFSATASEFFARRLERELSLSAEQSRAIAAILEETRREADTLRNELRPRIGTLMEAASERIQRVLSPEQRRRFLELREAHRSRADQFFLGPPGGHGHGRPPWQERPWRGERPERHPPPEAPPPEEPPPPRS